MRTIFLILDSLNRHFLDCYGGGGKAITPNIDRLAQRAVIFDNHWCGSMPCMPARREMLTGRLNFLETPWSPVMPWDRCLPGLLREAHGIYSHMITDHYHYFHSGGECYHTLFDSWELERGQEGDCWRPLVQAPEPAAGRGRGHVRKAYWRNRACLNPEDDLSYPTPRCFQRAVEFLDMNRDADNWHLHLEVFDPHEPFDSPQKYRDLYNDTWQRYWYNWPEYSRLDPQQDDAEAVAHIRKCYAATLTMADVWLGKLLDKMDELDLWKDTVLLVTTDHGHMLGEHGYWAKNYQFDYRELAQIPLLACVPGIEPGRRAGMSATMDIVPTLLDYHHTAAPDNVHGVSLRKLLEGNETVRTETLFGYFGKDVNYTDGRYTYCRQPLEGSHVHHYTALPRGFSDYYPEDVLRQAEAGVYLPSQRGIPCWRITEASRRHRDAADFNEIYDLQIDPGQEHPIRDEKLEERLAGRLQEMLRKYEAPDCQYSRLGLSPVS